MLVCLRIEKPKTFLKLQIENLKEVKKMSKIEWGILNFLTRGRLKELLEIERGKLQQEYKKLEEELRHKYYMKMKEDTGLPANAMIYTPFPM